MSFNMHFSDGSVRSAKRIFREQPALSFDLSDVESERCLANEKHLIFLNSFGPTLEQWDNLDISTIRVQFSYLPGYKRDTPDIY